MFFTVVCWELSGNHSKCIHIYDLPILSEVELKFKFFTSHLYRIETESQALLPSTRKIIFTHLAAFLPVGIQTLTKRAKKLRFNEQDDKLKDPINRLREGKKSNYWSYGSNTNH